MTNMISSSKENAIVSLEELASGSLPAWGGSSSFQPTWSRSLGELYAANDNSSHPDTGRQPTAAAQVLLQSSLTDFGNLVRAKSTVAPQPKLPTLGSVAEVARKHRDGILERILDRERELAQERLEASLQRQLDEDWAQERAWWQKELVGTRNLVDSSLQSRSLMASTSLGPSSSSSGTNVTGSLLLHSSSGIGSSGNRSAVSPQYMHQHWQLLKSMDPSSTNAQDICQRFSKLATPESGYLTAWQLISSMLFKVNETTTSATILGAQGSLLHLSKQYQSLVQARVNQASLAGQTTNSASYGTGMGGTIATYVQLTHGSQASVWHILYFCLRCGDAVAASQVLGVTPNLPEYALLTSVLTQFRQTQGRASCLWEAQSYGSPLLVSAALNQQLVDIYQKTKNMEPENTFKIDVLALLAAQELVGTYPTIEDYLFGRLWLALQQTNATTAVEGIAASICKYGPDHFGQGWGYALPLLAAQQFQKATTYLAETGGPDGLLQAAHLGWVLHSQGIDLQDAGKPKSTQNVVTALLIKYSQLVESEASLGPLAALDYLLLIPEKDRARREIAAMLTRSTQLVDQLAGIPTEDGGRRPGELDNHMDKIEVSMVLAEAADMMRRHSNGRHKGEMAAKFYMLAGRFASLLAFLNEMISPAAEVDAEKLYWTDQSQRFFNTYLSQRSLVLATLEKENNAALIETHKRILVLRSFYDKVREKKWEDGLEMALKLGLLPMEQDHLNEMASKFKDLDPVLSSQFPTFLSSVVQCLWGIHQQVQSDSRGRDPNVEARLRELQFKARYLYIFSGLIHMPSSTKQDIQQLRNHMI